MMQIIQSEITKLSSFFWYDFHILNNYILVNIINFLHIKILSNVSASNQFGISEDN